MENIFFDLTVIICLAALFSIIFRLLKQPAILAYILTGIIIAPFHFFDASNQPLLLALSQVGITLLLFMVGLEIRITELMSMGKMLLLSSAWQISLSFILGFLISATLGFDRLSSFYIATAITFSSTIIVVKLLSDQHELHSLHGKFSLGILLSQDVVAIVFLMFLTAAARESPFLGPVGNFVSVLIKGVLIIAAIAFLSKNIFPKLFERIARSSETLFLASLGWVFGLAAFVSSKFIGFSIEIGGFLAGVALANSLVNYQIIAKAKILRDFFIVIFFVLLGIQMSFANIAEIFVPAIILSLFVLIAKPFIVMVILGLLGYKKRTSFLTGVSLSQISEFSLILAFLGLSLGHIDQKTVSLITMVGLITFAVSTYMITHWKTLYRKFEKTLSFLEKKDSQNEKTLDESSLESLDDHVVVIGGDQMGASVIEALEDQKVDIVLVDFDPTIVKKYEKKEVGQRVFWLFGDISDLDIQQRAKLDNARMVISTIPDIEDNLLLLKELRHENRRAKIVMMAIEGKEARTLYREGADYVVLPHLAGGRQIAKLIEENALSKLEKLKDKDKKYLK
ncbi:MAG: cation:proton antiporter [Candidatus Levybacteria bacterium]|nr:cation:proton antiporter [Candidatus Levybacteria bacterium]